ncbi:MAG: hypothetical protein DRH12_17800, partial [Deltaproteobacteria bacterium]
KTREDWENEGCTNIHQRALEKAKYILETHTPEPLRESTLAEIRSIVEEAEKELGVYKKG